MLIITILLAAIGLIVYKKYKVQIVTFYKAKIKALKNTKNVDQYVNHADQHSTNTAQNNLIRVANPQGVATTLEESSITTYSTAGGAYGCGGALSIADMNSIM